jgi:2',3'-cyclic-nucleotide 2'-phosphodiesterase/3'-nucleotidase
MRQLNYLRIFLALIATVPFLGVSAREVPITILHTCDLHGNILPTENYDGKTNLGGFARCATVIKDVRAKEKNVLLVDAGDTIQGAAVSFLSDGMVMVKALNHLRYNGWAWGNHEFDWGLEKLARCAEESTAPILNANVKRTGEDRSADHPAVRIASRLKSYVLEDVDGVKVGIIGLNTPGIPNWSQPRLIEGLRFVDSVQTLKEVVPKVREAGAQVIVLVCHQGYREAGDDHANQVRAIAANFPELDVIIGGHTHKNVPEFKVSNVLYCQADYFGIHLGRLDLVFDTEQKKLTQRRSNTLAMDEKVASDPEILKLAGSDLDRAEKVLATVLGEATGEFTLRGAPKKESSIHNLIAESLSAALARHGVKVDAVIHGILDKRGTLAKGPVTRRDVWRIVPYENTVGVAQLLPSELEEILEENADAYRSVSFRGIWGLKCAYAPEAAPGSRVIKLTRMDGTELPANDRLAVAFNSYELASGGLRWNRLREIVGRSEVQLRNFDFQTREAMAEFIREKGKISPQLHGWWSVVPESE